MTKTAWLNTDREDTVQRWKKDEEKRIEEEHQKLVSRMIASAEGLSTAWRVGVQVLEEVERDVKLFGRCEEKRKGWAKNCQCNTEVQDLEEVLPRLRKEHLEKAARSYKAATSVGCDGFHPKVPLDLPKETRG